MSQGALRRDDRAESLAGRDRRPRDPAARLGLPEETSSLLDYDLTLQQIRAFALIFARGQTPITKVADALGIRPNVATGIIQRLVDRGLIERHEDPATGAYACSLSPITGSR